jgi:hypothetical protein
MTINSTNWQIGEIVALERKFQDTITDYAIAIVDFGFEEDDGDVQVTGNFVFGRGGTEYKISLRSSGEISEIAIDFPLPLIAKITNVMVQSLLDCIDYMLVRYAD